MRLPWYEWTMISAAPMAIRYRAAAQYGHSVRPVPLRMSLRGLAFHLPGGAPCFGLALGHQPRMYFISLPALRLPTIKMQRWTWVRDLVRFGLAE